MMSEQLDDLDNDEPEDTEADYKAKMRKRYKDQILAQQRALAEAGKQRAKLKADEAKRRKADDTTALHLKPESEYQQAVESRLTPQTTLWLGEAIRALAKSKTPITERWVCVQQHHARDVMTRAYPLALQMGFVVLPEDRTYSLKFMQGARLEFVWPGKAAV